jgi:hypothetical protein
MDEIGTCGIQPVEGQTFQQRKLLKGRQPLTPGTGLQDAIAAVVVADRLLDGGRPSRHIGAGEQAAMGAARHVHHFLGAAEFFDGFGDKALRPNLSRPLDFRLTPSRPCSLAQHARIGFGKRRIAEHHTRRRDLAFIQPQRSGRGPMSEKMVAHRRDRRGGALDKRMALLRVADRGAQRLGKRDGAVIAQQQHEGIEASWHARREQAGAGDKIEAQLAEARHCGAGRSGTLAAYHLRATVLRIVDDDRHISAGTVQMRLHDLQDEGGRDSRVKGVAATFEHTHADRCRDPVGARGDAEGPLNFGPRRE